MVNVEVREEPERTVCALRHVGPYKGIGAAFERLSRHVRGKGYRVRSEFAVFCDNPAKVPTEDLLSVACIGVEGEPAPEGEVEVRRVPGGLVAWAAAKGPYGGPAVHAAYDAVYDWIREGGEYVTLDAGAHKPFETTCREAYPNDPGEVPPEEVLTEVLIPARRK